MFHSCTKRWWVLILWGICAILFGIYTVVAPAMTLWLLAVLFGAFAFADGISSVLMGFSGGGGKPWWEMLLIGLLGIAAGVIAFLWPDITILALLIVIAVSAILRGIFQIIAAIRLRKLIDDEWVLGLSGVLSVAFGMLLLIKPNAGVIAIALLIGAYMIAIGAMAIALGLRLWRIRRRLTERHAAGLAASAS